MLNIQFTVEDGNEAQARGVVAALYAIYGDKVLPPEAVNLYSARVGDVVISGDRETVMGGREVKVITDELPAIEDAAAAFGTTLEPDAAAAFGGASDLGNDAFGKPRGPGGAAPAPTGERDKDGIPWDERIHSGTKEKTQQGVWKRRRNTPDATFDAVMTELRAANTSRTMEAAAGIVPPPPPASNVPAPPTTSPAPSPTPAAPAASSTAQGATDFPSIMRKVTGLQAAGKINPEQVANLLASVGANPPSVSSLHRDAGLIPAFEALLDDHVAMQG